MTKNKALCILGALASALFAAGWWLYGRRSKERIPSNEGLDDPAVAQAFGQIAEMPQMRLLHRFVVQRAMRMTQHGGAVDLGCGPGHLAILLAQRAPELHVTGVDLADEMLSQGEKLAARAGVGDHVSFRKGDARQIPVPNGSVDLVVSTLSLHHWSDPVAVLDEIARVLRPAGQGHRGGSFLIFDLRRDMAMPLWLLLWFATHCVVPVALRRVNEPMGSRNAAYTPQEAAELARRSRLSGWHITAGPLWLTIEGAVNQTAFGI